MAKIVTLRDDRTNEIAYPETVSGSVHMKDGTTLDRYIEDGYYHGADLRGYKVVSSISELPQTDTKFGYLIGTDLYVWVGTDGDTLGGKYKNCGPFKGPQGEPGFGFFGFQIVGNDLTVTKANDEPSEFEIQDKNLIIKFNN